MRRLAIGVLLALLASTGTAASPPSTWEPPLSAFRAVVVDDPPKAPTVPAPPSPIRDWFAAPTAPLPPQLPAVPATTVVPATGCATVACARSFALSVLGSTQYGCLDILFTRESHWNPFDLGPLTQYGRAYGIPQALPGSKMAWAGSDWRTNAVTQVRWGLHYIAGRYGTACAALGHSNVYGWY